MWVVIRRDEFYENGADFSEAQRDCKCKPIRAAIMHMKRSGLEGVIKKYTFDAFKAETPYQQYMLKRAQEFIQSPSPMFYIGGASGSGKTHICTAIVAQLLREGKAAYYIFYLQRKQRRTDAMQEAHAAASRKESLLMLELQMATAKLAYAVACAIKRGEPNGEVEEGIKAYEAEKARYIAFISEQAINHLHD